MAQHVTSRCSFHTIKCLYFDLSCEKPLHELNLLLASDMYLTYS